MQSECLDGFVTLDLEMDKSGKTSCTWGWIDREGGVF